jgi:hypothetical protein
MVLLSHCPLLEGAVTSYARNCEWTSDVTIQRQSKATGHGSQGAEIREVHTAYSTHLGCAEAVLAITGGPPSVLHTRGAGGFSRGHSTQCLLPWI